LDRIARLPNVLSLYRKAEAEKQAKELAAENPPQASA
jgi:hypothetical protein